ncbi:hypothetical protein ABW11_21175 [Pluralibacter gergoviae]|nr:hypothetical protein ABW11_21175 [Pluralibacter gergoviae]
MKHLSQIRMFINNIFCIGDCVVIIFKEIHQIKNAIASFVNGKFSFADIRSYELVTRITIIS